MDLAILLKALGLSFLDLADLVLVELLVLHMLDLLWDVCEMPKK